MKNAFLSFTVFLVCLLAVGSYVYSQGVGGNRTTKEKRDVAAFTKVLFQWPGELVLSQSGSNTLEIRGPKNVLGNISTEVVNGELIIKAKDPSVVKKNGDTVRFELGTSNLQQITLNSSGRVKTDERFSTENMTLIVDGSGTLVFAMKGNTLTAEVKGSGDILVSGIIEEEVVTLTGSGKYEGSGLLTQNAKVTLNGSGSIWINVANKLDATVNGKGVIRYGGVPTVTKKVSGGGKVQLLS